MKQWIIDTASAHKVVIIWDILRPNMWSKNVSDSQWIINQIINDYNCDIYYIIVALDVIECHHWFKFRTFNGLQVFVGEDIEWERSL